MPRHDLPIRSLAFATDIDVLPEAALVTDRGPFVSVRTPTNPAFHWGNFLLFPSPPVAGDRERWEAAFCEEFRVGGVPAHVALAWDVSDGDPGAASEELEAAGYELEHTVALVAGPGELTRHERASSDVAIRPLDPAAGADAGAWAAVLALQGAGRRPGHEEEADRACNAARLADLRTRFRAGDGSWFVAELAGEVVASCGVVVTGGRGRFQLVDTAAAHRRRGVATRLVYEAGRTALAELGAAQLVILAEEGYHALELYESLGFVARERSIGACWWPGAPEAALHPRWGARTDEPLG